MLKYLASYALFVIIVVGSMFKGAAGGLGWDWLPERKELEVMSIGTAIAVVFATLLAIIGTIYLLVQAFSLK